MENNMISRRAFLGTMGAVVLAVGAGLVGCGSQNGSGSSSGGSAPSSNASGATDAAAAGSKSIIVVWSWSGNTLKMAERVSELTGAEIYRIEAADPYPTDYDATADRAKQERDDKVYPKIANPLDNWDAYDTVFMGYPIWWYELPMIVQTFVRDHDWTGKTVVPFNSHEGSGDGGTYQQLRELTGATALEGIAIRGGDVASSLDEINTWYEGLDL